MVNRDDDAGRIRVIPGTSYSFLEARVKRGRASRFWRSCREKDNALQGYR